MYTKAFSTVLILTPKEGIVNMQMWLKLIKLLKCNFQIVVIRFVNNATTNE